MLSIADNSSGVQIVLNKLSEGSWTIEVKLSLGGPVLSGAGRTERAARDTLIMNMRKVHKILAYLDQV